MEILQFLADADYPVYMYDTASKYNCALGKTCCLVNHLCSYRFHKLLNVMLVNAVYFCTVPPDLNHLGKAKRHITVKAGSVAIFEVPFTAYPTPEVSWKHGSNDLPKEKRIQEETISCFSTLRLKECQLSDAGEYTVTLKNEHGELSTSYRLRVLDKPEAPRDLKVDAISEDSVSLSWLVPALDGGSPIKGYVIEKREASRRSWQKAGTTRDTKFTIKPLLEGQGYCFQVRAENEYGLSEPVEISQPATPTSQCGEKLFRFCELSCVFVTARDWPQYF